MGAGANSNRNKALNDRKRRAAGRIKDTGPEAEAIKDYTHTGPQRGRAAGASGKQDRPNRNPKAGPFTTGGGGATPTDKVTGTGRSTQPARRRGSAR